MREEKFQNVGRLKEKELYEIWMFICSKKDQKVISNIESGKEKVFCFGSSGIARYVALALLLSMFPNVWMNLTKKKARREK